jgi:hypothetical protein
MRWLFLFFYFLVSFSLQAQENYEIQVYASQTQPKNSTIFELHSNYTFNGEKQVVKGVRPTYNAFHETVEITHGISENIELGFYLFTNYLPHYGFRIVGTHLRPRVMAPTKWNLPVGLSLSSEIGYQSENYSTETWNIEIRPIIDKQWSKLYVSLNPTLGVQLKGVENQSAPSFEPNAKISYAFFKNIGLGAEYYGDFGAISAFDAPKEQGHALFVVMDLLNNNKWELNIGPGFGLTPATDDFVFKILVGKKVKWK